MKQNSTLLLLATAGCAHHAAPLPPPMPTSATVPELSGFTAEEYVEGEATVLAVNRTDRKVTLQNAEGQTTTERPSVSPDRAKPPTAVHCGLSSHSPGMHCDCSTAPSCGPPCRNGRAGRVAVHRGSDRCRWSGRSGTPPSETTRRVPLSRAAAGRCRPRCPRPRTPGCPRPCSTPCRRRLFDRFDAALLWRHQQAEVAAGIGDARRSACAWRRPRPGRCSPRRLSDARPSPGCPGRSARPAVARLPGRALHHLNERSRCCPRKA